MDQIQVGHFIKECRKEKGMTQAKLAEIMGVSDRAVSKWETGKSMPDSSIMLGLCEVLGITANELLTGRRKIMEDYGKKANELTVELYRTTEKVEKMSNIICGVDFLINVLLLIIGNIPVVQSLLQYLNNPVGFYTISGELFNTTLLCVIPFICTIFGAIYFIKLKMGKETQICYYVILFSVFSKIIIFITLMFMCFIMGVPQVMNILST